MISGDYLLSGLWGPMANAVRGWLMPYAQYYGYSGEIVSGFRSFEDQDRKYRLGRSQYEYNNHIKKQGRDGAVTDAWAGASAHNYGLAVDVEGRDQAKIIALGRQIGFGTVSWDPAHLEWPGWQQLLG